MHEVIVKFEFELGLCELRFLEQLVLAMVELEDQFLREVTKCKFLWFAKRILLVIAEGVDKAERRNHPGVSVGELNRFVKRLNKCFEKSFLLNACTHCIVLNSHFVGLADF